MSYSAPNLPHVHQNLVHWPAVAENPLVEPYSTCWTAIEQQWVPKYSVANGAAKLGRRVFDQSHCPLRVTDQIPYVGDRHSLNCQMGLRHYFTPVPGPLSVVPQNPLNHLGAQKHHAQVA